MAEGKWKNTISGLVVPGESHFLVEGEVEGYIISNLSGSYQAFVYPPGKKSEQVAYNATEAKAKAAVEEY